MSLQDDVDPLYAILQQVDEDINMDNLRSINLIRESLKRDSSLSIPKDAWKLLIQVYEKEIKKFTDARKVLEAQLKAGQPPSPRQYKAQIQVNLLSQEPRDIPVPDSIASDRQACSLRAKILSDETSRHVNTARSTCLSPMARSTCLSPTIPMIPLDIGGG